ncbi:uncharacterized protein FIESC28_11826 [Fusarium coffeatum]|uniref:Uncharacterized protein n=1 Tax=Fusarium coffeatum TaxID=231269 RepID=A0A366QGC1_9HYPO|nr:uncharacterized protein FIESC28_11826 [Fusarium coffeatum]RBR02900.1 hypothetical protein FIESC28_11826 [Fusarium coffeatum]
MKLTANVHITANTDIHHLYPIFAFVVGDTIVPIAAMIFRAKSRSATTEAPTPGLMSTRNGITVDVTSMKPTPNKNAPMRGVIQDAFRSINQP